MPATLVTFTVRCLLVALFLPFSALDKVLNFEQAIDQASQAIPGRAFATVMIAGGFCIEVSMSLAILGGVADRLAALILAGYCLVTALLWKQFWRRPDFRLKGRSEARDVFWDFLKNTALAGGFLLLAFGSNAADADRFIRHPLASSHPYRTVQEDLR
ncbi:MULTISPECIES: DoxX family membrane protein [unclassified Mesorhizobium]|uniref:DoxX family membrane protein n=1 Tax=unclassified Mesorhizobium TaxID=325217 RepID=UPI00112EA891|nr:MULTISPECIES: DoxX family membrane protein [unclassified Mesorhizobium]TPN57344.1 DoxX family membrane protein [Mesorhizobium sp. B1-1-7]TPN57709.1 DoxX family membrane protein [Mesorhizobium sp. B1-1-9]